MAMNPEREKMLREASNQEQEHEPPKPLRVRCIRITGSNVLALEDADAAEPSSDRPGAATWPSVASQKRSYDSFVQEDLGDVPFDNRLHRQRPPFFPLPPPPSHDTTYLASLLQSWTLRLKLEPKPTKKSVPTSSTHMEQITSVGLLNRLSASQKYDMARRIRKLVSQLRKIPQKNARLGSSISGEFSLMLDKHQNNTHWAVRPEPSHSMFISFLMSSFWDSVPGPVGATLADQLKREAPLAMSHGHICPQNIIVDKFQIVAITGWDCAGWYPDWWEYVKFFEARTSDKNSDWYEYAGEIFSQEFPTELAIYQGVVRCQTP
ncbi:Aminoglycoside phosphotransferase [Metarhizium album ARSEF 1941]|uniref:Aminoglycoside phosphotransferase n=1 Tax=Metarhizium album (strain ARSEF 1941) TaxID=1081103 RepID=A0A0B2WK20_METAS|nr:Aminoglycoside phosphotransferase [Metarhizium album ARSEF 1941]KHN94243.1 Aminoglycoside phosphotransferase [Metarhizium album ARSEF 1941]